MTAIDVGHRVIVMAEGAAESIQGYYGHVVDITGAGIQPVYWTKVQGRAGTRPAHPKIVDSVWPFGPHEIVHAD